MTWPHHNDKTGMQFPGGNCRLAEVERESTGLLEHVAAERGLGDVESRGHTRQVPNMLNRRLPLESVYECVRDCVSECLPHAHVCVCV